MERKIKIFCRNTSEYIDVEGGATLAEVASQLADELTIVPICARVNNKTEDLGFPIYSPKQVEFLDQSRLLHDQAHQMEVNEQTVTLLRDKMRSLAESDIPFLRRERLTSDAINLFRREGQLDKVTLLETVHDLYTTYYKLDGLADSYYGPLAPSTGMLKVFDLCLYKEGFLLLSCDKKDPSKPNTPVDQEKMYHAFTEYLKFNRIIKVGNVGELNLAVKRRETAQLINVAEAMHDKLLGRISDDIARRREQGGASIVLLAGPSSSGKTTTNKRLAIQLMTNLIVPKMISLDDYFIDRERTPLDEDGLEFRARPAHRAPPPVAP